MKQDQNRSINVVSVKPEHAPKEHIMSSRMGL